MLKVELDHIISDSDVAQKIQAIMADVEQNNEMYVITNAGRPVAAIVSMDQIAKGELEKSPLNMPAAVPSMSTPPVAPMPIMNTPPSPPPAIPAALPEMPPLPPLPSQEPASLKPAIPSVQAPQPPMPQQPLTPPAPGIPVQPSGTMTMPLPSMGSPLNEEPPEDTPGPLIPQIPVIQNLSTQLPPLSGAQEVNTPPPVNNVNPPQ